MKKISLKNKLSLNKETVAKLNNSQMSLVNGGGSLNHDSCSGCTTRPPSQSCPPNTVGACLTDNCVSLVATDAGCPGC